MSYLRYPKHSFNNNLHYKSVDELLSSEYIKLIHNLLIPVIKDNHNTSFAKKNTIDKCIEKLYSYIQTNKRDKSINSYVYFYEKLGFETTKLVIAFEVLYCVIIHDLGDKNNYLSSQLFTLIIKNAKSILSNEYNKISKDCQISFKDIFNGEYKIKLTIQEKINKISII